MLGIIWRWVATVYMRWNYSRVDIQDRTNQFTRYLDADRTALTLDSRRGAVLSAACHVAPPQYAHKTR